MAKFDPKNIVWSWNGRGLPEGTIVYYAETPEEIKNLVEKGTDRQTGVVAYSNDEANGKATVIDLWNYLGDELKRTFIYPVFNPSKDTFKYIKRAENELSDQVVENLDAKETFEKHGLVGYAEKKNARLFYLKKCLELAESNN